MKSFIPIIFATSVLAVFILAITYLSRRFAGYFNTDKTILFFFAFALILTFTIVAILTMSNTTGQMGHILYASASVLLGFILYLLLSVIVIDIVKLFIHIPPRISATIVLSLATLVSSYGIINASYIRTTNLSIPLKNLSQEIKALHLSDIHIGHFRGEKTMKEIVKKANILNPDIILITGDFFDGVIGVKDEIFKTIKEFRAPIYFVEGNHDEYTNIVQIKRKLKDVGVNVLENKIEEYKGLQIVGIDHMVADKETFDMHASANKSTIQETLSELPINDSKPSILLHHSPDGIEYADQNGIDLFLTGHTHAGQIFPINIIANFMFNYNRGLHSYNNTKIFVSEGVGTFGPPMRVGTISEMVLLNLVPQN